MESINIDTPTSLLKALKSFFGESYSNRDLRWTIEHNRCWVGGLVERFASKKLIPGERVKVWPEKAPRFICDSERILYEDDELLIYNKPPFIASEDLAKLFQHSLVHRLDRDTTGCLLLAKTLKARQALERLFFKRKVKKTYHALVQGDPKIGGTISTPIKCVGRREGAVIYAPHPRGDHAQTVWKKLGRQKVVCYPKTGRTHQIRVHLKSVGLPILGDFEYGSKKALPGLFRPMLHAAELKFSHPTGEKTIHSFAPPPDDFLYWERRLDME